MHGTGVKITEAQQAKICNSYKNTKLMLLKTNAAIWINKLCKEKEECDNMSINFAFVGQCTK
jgi:hypothetical protein